MAARTEVLEQRWPRRAAPALPAIAPAPPRRPLQARRAWRAIRSLVADPTRTEQVFELFGALGGDYGEVLFQRFLRNPAAPSLLARQPSLVAALSDREALARLPEGSFGRAYLAFLDARGLDPAGLLEARSHANTELPPLDPIRDWFYARTNVMHDLWHVLTGYGTDEAGEAALLAFSLAQLPSRGMRVLVGAAAVIGFDWRLEWPRYLMRAWRRGRRAVLLTAVAYEDLLPRPLDEARRRLGIEPAHVAHPQGILVGDRASGGLP